MNTDTNNVLDYGLAHSLIAEPSVNKDASVAAIVAPSVLATQPPTDEPEVLKLSGEMREVPMLHGSCVNTGAPAIIEDLSREDVDPMRPNGEKDYRFAYEVAGSMLGQLLDYMGPERFADALISVVTSRGEQGQGAIERLAVTVADAFPTIAAEAVIAYADCTDEQPLIDALGERGDNRDLLSAIAIRWGDVHDWCELHPKYHAGTFLKASAREMSVDEWCELHAYYEPGIPSGDVTEAVEHLDDVIDTLERAKRLLNGE